MQDDDFAVIRARVFSQPSPHEKLKIWRDLLSDPRWIDYVSETLSEKIKMLRRRDPDLYIRATMNHAVKTGELAVPCLTLTKYQRVKLLKRLNEALLTLSEKMSSGKQLKDIEIDAIDSVVELFWIGKLREQKK